GDRIDYRVRLGRTDWRVNQLPPPRFGPKAAVELKVLECTVFPIR
ncbi:MAG: hypothetical protein HY815_12175, partial [Candidatus Riflebacteria bacterium]|nr:hypothetical protein [Candidatus Riflebacteria bacterium]